MAKFHYHYLPSSEKYEYTPLKSNSDVRIAMLQTFDEHRNDIESAPLAVTIVLTELPTTQNFIALSYAPTPRQTSFKTIETPKGSIECSSVLHESISTLRRFMGADLALWSSELCNEPKDQVQANNIWECRSIFENATQVAIILGPDDDNIEHALEIFAKLGKIDVANLPRSWEDLQKRGFPSKADPSWGAVDKFVAHPWFRWVGALPACLWAKKVHLVGQNWAHDFEMFQVAVLKAKIIGFSMFGLAHNTDEVSNGIKCMINLAELRGLHQVGKRYGFIELLRRCATTEAETLQERLLTLASLSENANEESLFPIKSDDSTDLALTYARFLFTRDGGIDLLSFAPSRALRQDEPSWMPAWFDSQPHRLRLNPEAFNTATAAGHNLLAISDCGKLLRLFCAPVYEHSTIAILSDNEAFGEADDTSTWSQILTMWTRAQQICEALRDPDGKPLKMYSRQEPLAEAMWSTFQKGAAFSDSGTPFAVSEAAAKSILMVLGTDDFREGMIENFEKAKLAVDQMSMQLDGWKFCILRNGLMGLVPLDARDGDLVMAVLGARTPFVFRSIDDTDHYRLVGECYIHGVMHGELRNVKLRFGIKTII